MIVTATELMDELKSADGEIYIADPSERVRAKYRRAIYAAKERRLVPEGFQLWHTGRDHGDMVIRLLKRHAQPPRIVQPPRAPDPVRAPITEKRVKRRTIDLKPALASLKVSKALLPRCRSILQELSDEVMGWGYEVRVGVEKSSLVIVASCEHLPFRLFEEQDTAPAPPPKRPEPRRYEWQQPPPSTIRVPTGRLALRLEHRYRNRTWADRSRWRLEDRLSVTVPSLPTRMCAAFILPVTPSAKPAHCASSVAATDAGIVTVASNVNVPKRRGHARLDRERAQPGHHHDPGLSRRLRGMSVLGRRVPLCHGNHELVRGVRLLSGETSDTRPRRVPTSSCRSTM